MHIMSMVSFSFIVQKSPNVDTHDAKTVWGRMAFASQNHFGIFDVNSLSSKVQRARQLKMKHSIDEFLFYYYLFFPHLSKLQFWFLLL